MASPRRSENTVLHVDDEEGVRELVAELLSRELDRFEVVGAASARDALERLERDDVDCVVSDYDMPGTNGLELLDDIREQHPDLPFILYTGKGSEEIAGEAITRGVTEYLQKQYGAQQYTVLANRIRNAVEKHNSKRALETREERFQSLLEHSSDLITTVDADGVIQYQSPSISRVLGYEPAELVGENALDFVHPDDETAVQSALQTALDDPDTTPKVEYRMRREDGSWAWLESIGNNQLDNPAVGEFILNSREVTERRERVQQIREQKATVEKLLEETVEVEQCERPADVFERLVAAGEDILNFDAAVADAPEDGYLVTQAVSSDAPDRGYYEQKPIDAEDSFAAEVYRTGDPVVVTDLPDHDVDPAKPSYRSALTVPIGEFGVFQAASESPDAFDDTDRTLSVLLCKHARGTLQRLTD
jgi:PAS domain S-box-containing protein